MSCELGVVPVEPVAGAVLLEQLELGDPVELAGAQHRVALETVEHRLPAGQDVDGLGVGVGAVAVLDELAGQVEVLQLQLDRRSACGRRCRVIVCFRRRVVRDRAQRRDRSLDAEVDGDELLLDHRQHQRGRADLEVRRDLGQVGVADDDVQAAVLLRVGVRLVAGVDDRALERGLEADLDLEEVRRAG